MRIRVFLVFASFLLIAAPPVAGKRTGPPSPAATALEHLRLRPADLPDGWRLLPGASPLPGEKALRADLEKRLLAPLKPEWPPPDAVVGVDRVEDEDGPFPLFYFSFADPRAAAWIAWHRIREDPGMRERVGYAQALHVIYVAPPRARGFGSRLEPMIQARVGKETWARAAVAFREGRYEETIAALADYTWAYPLAQPLAFQAIALAGLGRNEDALATAEGARAARDFRSLGPEDHASLLHAEGTALLRLGREKPARLVFEEGVRNAEGLSPETIARAHLDLARLHAGAGRRKEATAELKLAIEAGGEPVRETARREPGLSGLLEGD